MPGYTPFAGTAGLEIKELTEAKADWQQAASAQADAHFSGDKERADELLQPMIDAHGRYANQQLLAELLGVLPDSENKYKQ